MSSIKRNEKLKVSLFFRFSVKSLKIGFIEKPAKIINIAADKNPATIFYNIFILFLFYNPTA